MKDAWGGGGDFKSSLPSVLQISAVISYRNRYLGEDFTDAGTQFAGGIQLHQIDAVSYRDSINEQFTVNRILLGYYCEPH